MASVKRVAGELFAGYALTTGLSFGGLHLLKDHYSPEACIESLSPDDEGRQVAEADLPEGCVSVARLMASETITRAMISDTGERELETSVSFTLPSSDALERRAEGSNRREDMDARGASLFVSGVGSALWTLSVWSGMRGRKRLEAEKTAEAKEAVLK